MSPLKYFQKWVSKRTPIFIENSRVPVWLSFFAPIEIGAITLGPLVFSRSVISEKTKRHETIHLHQQIELAFIFFYFLYFSFWLFKLVKLRSGSEAYRQIPFEREAKTNEEDKLYLEHRKIWAWTNYVK